MDFLENVAYMQVGLGLLIDAEDDRFGPSNVAATAPPVNGAAHRLTIYAEAAASERHPTGFGTLLPYLSLARNPATLLRWSAQSRQRWANHCTRRERATFAAQSVLWPGLVEAQG